jgi:sirohydrochlorin ferrochelatase
MTRGHAVVLVGHGSRVRGFERPMRRLAERLRSGPYAAVRCAYLELARPSVSEAVDALARAGARRVTIVPYFLLGGRHVTEDIPEAVRLAKRRHRGNVVIALAPYLGFHERLVAVVERCIREAR